MEIISVGELGQDIIVSIALSKDDICTAKGVTLESLVFDNITKDDVLQELKRQINASTE